MAKMKENSVELATPFSADSVHFLGTHFAYHDSNWYSLNESKKYQKVVFQKPRIQGPNPPLSLVCMYEEK